MATKKKTMTLDEFIAEAKRLRKTADSAEGTFLSFLYRADKTPKLWASAGLPFADLLERYSICKATRYIKYRNTYDTCGKLTTQVGAHAAVAAASLPADLRTDALREAKQWEKTNGTSISAQSARRIVRGLQNRTVGQRTRNKSYMELLEENEQLREENEQLRAEIGVFKQKAAA